MVGVAIEDGFTVAGGFDGDGFVGGAFECEVKGTVEGGGEGVYVVEALGAVEAGMDEDGGAGFRFLFPNHAPIAEAGALVGFEDAGEGGFLAIALVVWGIHVENAAGGGGLGFGASADFDGLGGLAGGAVWAR